MSPELFPYFRAHPVPYPRVTMQDGFWAPRQQTAREVTIPWVIAAHEAGGGPRLGEMEHVKFIEAMATAAPAPEARIDAWAHQLIDAQAADGYLADRYPPGFSRPPSRWEVVRGWASHEDYLIGHYIEAAIAYREATGREELYRSALRAADNMAEAVLDRPYTSGHPEIEQALMRLYAETADERYLRLCGRLLDQRGRHEGRPTYGRHAQDHAPITEQRTIEGHAVCAAYLWNGVTQYVGATGDAGYRDAALAVWDDLERGKLYLHGAGGNLSSTDEGYLTEPCRIAPDDCYGESCAVVANFRWAHSLFALTGEARYLDAAERMLYNAFPASLSLAGDRSFYTNVAQTGLPATARGALTLTAAERRPDVRFAELATSCCPPNIVKLINTVGGYFYSTDDDGIYVKHYGASEADIPLGDGVRITQRTDYPWDGAVTLVVDPATPRDFTLRLRVPAWASEPTVSFDAEAREGWLSIRREWRPGDRVELNLPMPVDRVTMPPHFAGYENRAALTRGPIVYCAEEQDLEDSVPEPGIPDLPASALNLVYIAADATFTPEHLPGFLGGVTVLRGELRALGLDGSERPVHAMLVPYAVWGNRGASEMRIWLGARPAAPLVFLFQQMGVAVGSDDWL